MGGSCVPESRGYSLGKLTAGAAARRLALAPPRRGRPRRGAGRRVVRGRQKHGPTGVCNKKNGTRDPRDSRRQPGRAEDGRGYCIATPTPSGKMQASISCE